MLGCKGVDRFSLIDVIVMKSHIFFMELEKQSVVV